ncbi:hypothetical protein LCGC14_2424350 [marine sediment metagenome]|uniref:GDP-mannose 4,6-dehydratase n=1 Tax=marine sediment metagenome TaxID=412755 RepID=A0A0F9EHW6_9ZZZZ
MFASNGILFNHESPRRGETFVTRKIIRGAIAIKRGKTKTIELGNLDAKRDWGFAGDYVEAIWRILQHDRPDDFVVSTGEYYSVKEFVIEAFNYVGLDPWKYVETTEDYYRPNEVPALLGDASKIRTVLHWKPKVNFKQLTKMMIDSDMKLAEKELREKNL